MPRGGNNLPSVVTRPALRLTERIWLLRAFGMQTVVATAPIAVPLARPGAPIRIAACQEPQRFCGKMGPSLWGTRGGGNAPALLHLREGVRVRSNDKGQRTRRQALRGLGRFRALTVDRRDLATWPLAGHSINH